jgi:hypothetical protein
MMTGWKVSSSLSEFKSFSFNSSFLFLYSSPDCFNLKTGRGKGGRKRERERGRERERERETEREREGGREGGREIERDREREREREREAERDREREGGRERGRERDRERERGREGEREGERDRGRQREREREIEREGGRERQQMVSSHGTGRQTEELTFHKMEEEHPCEEISEESQSEVPPQPRLLLLLHRCLHLCFQDYKDDEEELCCSLPLPLVPPLQDSSHRSFLSLSLSLLSLCPSEGKGYEHEER